MEALAALSAPRAPARLVAHLVNLRHLVVRGTPVKEVGVVAAAVVEQEVAVMVVGNLTDAVEVTEGML